ncbi:MAG: adenylate/guanylate cyclase domain-containing protein [Planctomycetes bacterium]|nr:adenylate/guanylate cyclase domain-containing protein [Planctomycetota bacterium]
MDTALARRRAHIVLVGAAIGAALGFAYMLAIEPPGWAAAARGMAAGAAIAGGVTLLETYGAASAAGRALRRLPFAAFVAVKVGLWIVWIMPVLAVVRHFAPPTERGTFVLAGDALYSLAVSFVIVSLMEVDRLLGPGVLWRLVIGRYHRPVLEDRAFLLLDIESSSGIAEDIGDERFLGLLHRVITDVSEAIVAHGGEIYRFVGDGIIVSWPTVAAVRDARILHCLAAVVAVMERNRETYRSEFGVAPLGRAAMHAGPIAVGEVGDARREIAFLGDTLNTASRMDQECRKLGRRALISSDLLARLAVPDGMRVESLGDVMLRGKSHTVALHAIEIG